MAEFTEDELGHLEEAVKAVQEERATEESDEDTGVLENFRRKYLRS